MAPTKDPDYKEDEINRLTEKYGTLPPLWAAFPHAHPYSIVWRMGSGESYKCLYWAWWKVEAPKLDESQRIEYFRRFPPPYAWLTRLIEQLWDVEVDFDEYDTFDYSPYFKRTEELGFGSEADYKKHFDDPKWLE